MASFTSLYNVLRAGAVDGRTLNVRYRQNELHSLHASLSQNIEAITAALSSENTAGRGEAETEVFLALDAIRKCYESLDFDRSLKEEYLITEGKSNPQRRIGYGVVAILPETHGALYSVVSPLAAAIAAGNCVLLQLDVSRSSHTFPLLSRILSTALDPGSFATINSKLKPEQLNLVDFVVDQTSSSDKISGLLSHLHGRTLAVVDGSANLEDAAKFLCTARLSNSAYAPDLIVVHETVGELFGMSCLKYANSIHGSDVKSVYRTNPETEEEDETLRNATDNGKVKIHRAGTTQLEVVEIMDRESPLKRIKVHGPRILILPSTSLSDAVMSQKDAGEFLALYIFAGPASAKFISEQIDSRISFINHIPDELLTGPISPSAFPPMIHPRYIPTMFSQVKPQIVGSTSQLPGQNLSDLRTSIDKPLPPTKQPKGFAIGFFEQGILIGLGMAALVVLPTIGFGIRRLVMHWVGSK